MKPGWVRALVLISTVVLAWGILAYGGQASRVALSPGEPAEREYVARRSAEVIDTAATTDLQDQAAAQVETITNRVRENEEQVRADVDELITAVRDGVTPGEPTTTTTAPPPTTTVTTVPPATTTTLASEDEGGGTDTTTTTAPVPQAMLEGLLFVDVDGDGLFEAEAPEEEQWRPDFGLSNIRVVIETPEGTELVTESQSDGKITLAVPEGELVVTIDQTDPNFPKRFVPSVGTLEQVIDCREGDCFLEAVGLTPDARPIDRQVEDLSLLFPLIPETSLETLATLATQDLVRTAAGEQPLALETIALKTNEELTELFAQGITSQNVNDVKASVQSDPPFFNIDGERNDDAREAVADIVAAFLVPNRLPDETATESARQQARQSVTPVTVEYDSGEVIATPGERLTQLQIDAIQQTAAATGETLREGALVAILAVLMGILGFYLARFRPQFWDRPRMVALWGLLIVLSAGAVRLTIELEDRVGWYVLPAVAFGYLAAVLFDNRMGTLMALGLGILTAAGTQEAGATVYAILAALAPIGFVSKVSSRRAFRNSVVTSAVAVSVVAATIAWYFDTGTSQTPWTEVGIAAAWAFGVSLVASLVALAAMPFFESMFDVTTTLRLLELTDRNHEALQLLQEKAFGTFNHSLMVGTLADGAAKAVGANNLLARAAAYYHDIGKTENPLYFIENQFGIPNPHDELPAEESAAIIRQHVIDGVRLAKRFKIPTEVAEGIVSHHGDGIMRYFYEKAREEGSNVDPDRFRHAGHKPNTKEMAILMMADSVEGACRAVFGDEEPTPDAIHKVVNRVIDEKVADGQLEESDLTLAELSRVRRAFIEALVGHYHQRIPYPNFPGS